MPVKIQLNAPFPIKPVQIPKRRSQKLDPGLLKSQRLLFIRQQPLQIDCVREAILSTLNSARFCLHRNTLRMCFLDQLGCKSQIVLLFMM